MIACDLAYAPRRFDDGGLRLLSHISPLVRERSVDAQPKPPSAILSDAPRTGDVDTIASLQKIAEQASPAKPRLLISEDKRNSALRALLGESKVYDSSRRKPRISQPALQVQSSSLMTELPSIPDTTSSHNPSPPTLAGDSSLPLALQRTEKPADSKPLSTRPTSDTPSDGALRETPARGPRSALMTETAHAGSGFVCALAVCAAIASREGLKTMTRSMLPASIGVTAGVASWAALRATVWGMRRALVHLRAIRSAPRAA